MVALRRAWHAVFGERLRRASLDPMVAAGWGEPEIERLFALARHAIAADTAGPQRIREIAGWTGVSTTVTPRRQAAQVAGWLLSRAIFLSQRGRMSLSEALDWLPVWAGAPDFQTAQAFEKTIASPAWTEWRAIRPVPVAVLGYIAGLPPEQVRRDFESRALDMLLLRQMAARREWRMPRR